MPHRAANSATGHGSSLPHPAVAAAPAPATQNQPYQMHQQHAAHLHSRPRSTHDHASSPAHAPASAAAAPPSASLASPSASAAAVPPAPVSSDPVALARLDADLATLVDQADRDPRGPAGRRLRAHLSWAVTLTPSPFGTPVPQVRALTYETTPLHLAVLAGCVRAVKRIVDRFRADGTVADVDAADSLGRTPLLACIFGVDALDITPENLPWVSHVHPHHAAILDVLVANVPAAVFGQGHPCIHHISPLILASYLGKDKYVTRMLEAGADVDAVDSHNGTALMYAARDNHVETVKKLLDYGASVTHRDDNGWTALDYGMRYDEVRTLLQETLKLDAEAAAAPNASNRAHEPPRDYDNPPPSSSLTPLRTLAQSMSLDPGGVSSASVAPPVPHAHPPPASAPAANGHSAAAATAAATAAALSAEDRVQHMYHEYCKVVEYANRIRGFEAFWMDRWYELVCRTIQFLDSGAQVAAHRRSSVTGDADAAQLELAIVEENLLEIDRDAREAQITVQTLKDHYDRVRLGPVQWAAAAAAAAESDLDSPVPGAANVGTGGRAGTAGMGRASYLAKMDDLSVQLQAQGSELSRLVSDRMTEEIRKQQFLVDKRAAAAAEVSQAAAAAARMAAYEAVDELKAQIAANEQLIKHLETTRHEEVAQAAHQLKLVLALLPPAPGSAGAGSRPTSMVEPDVGALLRGFDASGGTGTLPATSPVGGGAGRSQVNTSASTMTTATTAALLPILDEVQARCMAVEAEVRRLREQNMHLLREVDQKDGTIRLFEHQVTWLKLNHETITTQQLPMSVTSTTGGAGGTTPASTSATGTLPTPPTPAGMSTGFETSSAPSSTQGTIPPVDNEPQHFAHQRRTTGASAASSATARAGTPVYPSLVRHRVRPNLNGRAPAPPVRGQYSATVASTPHSSLDDTDDDMAGTSSGGGARARPSDDDEDYDDEVVVSHEEEYDVDDDLSESDGPVLAPAAASEGVHYGPRASQQQPPLRYNFPPPPPGSAPPIVSGGALPTARPIEYAPYVYGAPPPRPGSAAPALASVVGPPGGNGSGVSLARNRSQTASGVGAYAVATAAMGGHTPDITSSSASVASFAVGGNVQGVTTFPHGVRRPSEPAMTTVTQPRPPLRSALRHGGANAAVAGPSSDVGESGSGGGGRKFGFFSTLSKKVRKIRSMGELR
ncbi:hypothetical protein AMAG_05341 [Allomyces macrogynus ATCC 38327]|uniref:Uncharacterized protein n=1 Tax=Allomyces macrogynus (strain ATCC 38327) TaxID=578462 RepID=A0A0L0SBN2_ALLM3|nr:hypothetical protein AMAG_05341 [Allomyces macrogynus ATCC 38327]|eukprot:KNE59891.1 hypothetical protein AMAG_05341 [Allomyces macrogynus ATCC 38327]